MKQYFLDHILPALVGLIGGGGSMYFIERKRAKKQVEAVGLENLEKGFEIYRGMLDDVTKRFEDQIKSLEIKIDHLEVELEECKKRH